MSETVKAILAILVLFAGLPVLIVWLRERIAAAIWNRRNPPEKLAADRRAFEARIVRPDWNFYEGHLKRPSPPVLRELYADQALVTAQGLDLVDDDDEIELTIGTFDPLDEQGLLETRPWLGFDAVRIATSDTGDPIYLRPGQSEPDTVFVTFHDGGDTEVLAESVGELFARLKRGFREG